jgi:hypothetical protein
MTALAAVAVTGLPPKVEMVAPFSASAISGRATVRAGHDIRRDAPLFDAEPFSAGASPAGLYFVADEKAAEFFHDAVDDLEIFFGRNDEAADALDRLGDEGGNAAGGGGANHVVHVAGALHVAGRVFQIERAAVAVGVDGVDEAAGSSSAKAPG